MESIKDKIEEVLESHYDYDLRNAYMRDLLASEIASKVDDDFEMPPQEHERELRRIAESREKGLFEKYLEDPTSVEDMNTEVQVEIPEDKQAEVANIIKERKSAKNIVNRKKDKPVKVEPTEKKGKPKKKPEMADFFDNKKNNKKTIKPKRKRGLNNLRKK